MLPLAPRTYGCPTALEGDWMAGRGPVELRRTTRCELSSDGRRRPGDGWRAKAVADVGVDGASDGGGRGACAPVGDVSVGGETRWSDFLRAGDGPRLGVLFPPGGGGDGVWRRPDDGRGSPAGGEGTTAAGGPAAVSGADGGGVSMAMRLAGRERTTGVVPPMPVGVLADSE